MKFNKSHYSVFAAILIASTLAVIILPRLSNKEANANSSENTAKQAQPLPLKPNATTPKAAETATTDPDDLLIMEEALSDFYSSEDEQDRESALIALGEFPDSKAREAILYALNDPEEIVREQAVSQIKHWEDEKERQQMFLAALNNDKPEIVVLALESIAEFDDPSLLEKINELSLDKNEDVVEAAKSALEMADLD